MKRENAKKLLPVIQAFAEGKDVQFWGKVISRMEAGIVWNDTDNPSFDGDPDEWRIKPEPLECWVVKNCDGDLYPHETKDGADHHVNCGSYPPYTVHRMREVI